MYDINRELLFFFFSQPYSLGYYANIYFRNNTMATGYQSFFVYSHGYCFIYWVKKQNLIDIVPIARDIVFENMYDAAFVLDLNGTIVDYNRSAEQIF